MKNITTDLADRLALLHVRHNVVFGLAGPSLPDFVAKQFMTTAHILAEGLRAEDPDTVAKVRGVVDPAELSGTSFWITNLGRLLFMAGGYGNGQVTQALAAGVLGCSRQWVHELVASRKLLSAPAPVGAVPARAVDAEQVRGLLKAKLDRPVK